MSWDDRNTEAGMGRKAIPARIGREALDVLEELRQEEEHAVHAGVDEPAGDVGRGAGARGRGAAAAGSARAPGARSARRGRAAPAHGERHDRDRGSSTRCRRPRRGRTRSPAMPSGGGERPDDVEAAVAPLGLDEHRAADQPDGEADRHVHEHDPAPRDQLGEQAAGDEADGAAGGRHRREEADRPDPLPVPRRRSW